MKQIVIGMITLCTLATISVSATEPLKPYILAGIQQGDLAQVQTSVSEWLREKGFELVGTYSPAQDDTLSVICLTHPLLREHAAKSGGLLGFSASLRVGLHQTEAGVEVAYMTPQYWGNAYYRKGYSEVEADYNLMDKALQEALGHLEETSFTPFGSKKGLSAKKLQKYHYMMSMPYFDDVAVLQDDLPYEEAISRIESRAGENSDADIVYAIKFPEQKMALYGIALTGEKGEQKFLPKIDFKEPRHTPFLPYELLVLEDQAVMLHGKYRIALSFPDLTMGTFMKIMSTPGDIENTLRELVTDKE